MALNLEELQEALTTQRAKSRTFGKFKVGKNRIRILMFKQTSITGEQNLSGDDHFFRMMVNHKKGNDMLKGVSLCRSQVLGEKCAFCIANQMSLAEGKTPPFDSRITYRVNAINFDTPDKISVYDLPPSVWEQIMEVVLDPEEWEDVLSRKNGHAFVITRTGEKLETRYTVTPSQKVTVVPPELWKKSADPLEKLKDPGFEAQCEKMGVDPADLVDDEPEEYDSDDVEIDSLDLASVGRREEEIDENWLDTEEDSTPRRVKKDVAKGAKKIGAAVRRKKKEQPEVDEEEDSPFDTDDDDGPDPWDIDDAKGEDQPVSPKKKKRKLVKRPDCFADPECHDGLSEDCHEKCSMFQECIDKILKEQDKAKGFTDEDDDEEEIDPAEIPPKKKKVVRRRRARPEL